MSAAVTPSEQPPEGRSFTKRYPDAPPGFFAVEAAGLTWLRAAGAGAAQVVGVLEVGSDFITVGRLTPARATPAPAEEFGRALAVTHAAGAAAFGHPPDGWTADGFIGRQPLSLRPRSRWGLFYAEAAALEPGWRELVGLHQLQPLLVHAVSHGGAYGVQAEHVARACA